VFYKTASDVVGKASTFVVLVAAARALSTPAFGLFSLASTLGWMLAVLTDLGLQMHLARTIARDPDRLSSIVPPLLRVRVSFAVTAIALTFIAFIRLPGAEAASFVLITGAYVVTGLVEFINYLYRAIERSELESSFNLLQRLMTVGAALLLLSTLPSLMSLALALFVPSVLVLGATLFTTARILTRRSGVAVAGVPPGFSRSIFLRDVLPIGAGIVLSALYFRIDLFLVQYWRGLDDVARYNAVFRMIDALRLFPAAVLTVALPAVFRRQDRQFTRQLAAGLLAFGIFTAIVVYLAAPVLVSLTYGPKYAGAVPVLRILILAFPALCLNYGLTHQLIGRGAQRAYAAVCAGALGGNVWLNAILIPRMGIAGAAWATLATEAAMTLAWISIITSTSAPDARGSSAPARPAIGSDHV
jgi:O-antigen/teichoic acid export membrane protein